MNSMSVIHPKCGPLALRLSAILLLGITRIHNVLIHFFYYCRDNVNTYYLIQMMYLVEYSIKHIHKLYQLQNKTLSFSIISFYFFFI